MFSTIRTAIFILGLMIVSSAATAAPTVFFKTDLGQDNTWIRPNVKVVNNDAAPMSMSAYTLEYYFYEPELSLSSLFASTWYYSLGDASRVQASFEVMDTPFVTGDLKANLVCRISFTQGTILAGDAMELGMGINAVTNGIWYVFDPSDDWSYVATSTYLEATNIVLRDAEGNIVFGEEPGNDVTPRPETIAVYWLGAHTRAEMNEIDLRAGDAYQDTDDGKAYVYYQDAWMPMDENRIESRDVAVNAKNDIGGDNVFQVLQSLHQRITALEHENTTLKNQVAENTSAISSILDAQSQFVTQSALDAALAGYVTVTELFDTLADYATKLFVEDALTGYATSEEAADLNARLGLVEDKTAPMSIEGDELAFTGVNVNILSGSGHTNSRPNGLGNLIVGYNEQSVYSDLVRSGSHNLVVGPYHEYSSIGGEVQGYHNSIQGMYATVNGGSYNTARGRYSSINGGDGNTTEGDYASVNGGQENTVYGQYAAIGGGKGGGIGTAEADYGWSAVYFSAPTYRNGFAIWKTGETAHDTEVYVGGENLDLFSRMTLDLDSENEMTQRANGNFTQWTGGNVNQTIVNGLTQEAGSISQTVSGPFHQDLKAWDQDISEDWTQSITGNLLRTVNGKIVETGENGIYLLNDESDRVTAEFYDLSYPGENIIFIAENNSQVY